MSTKLAIIIVNWNVRDLLRKCLQSIDRAAPPDTHVIVVDSASTDDSVKMLHAEFPQVQLITNARNVGFTAGNNQGLAALFRPHNAGGMVHPHPTPSPLQGEGRDIPPSPQRGEGQGVRGECRAVEIAPPEYILLLNPDTEIVGDALATMLAYLDAHSEVGALGPQLLNTDGSVQSSRRRFPTLLTAFMESTVLQQRFPDNRVLRDYYIADKSDDEIQEVDWVVGACILARGAVVAEVGGLDERFFMYSEELDWCYRVKQHGWQIVYLPTAQVIHHGGKSSEQVVAPKHVHFQSSKIKFFRKHFGAVWGEVLRVFLLGTYLYQLLEEGAKWLVGHKRDLRAARVRAYWQVLKSGLMSRDHEHSSPPITKIGALR